jgi:hypothetical protein
MDTNMHRDPHSLEEIEWSLWCALMCQCENCGAVLDLGQFDDLADANPIEWAKVAAPFVKERGWSTPREFELLCPECTKQWNRL